MSDLEPREVELRRAARERALELLYEAEAKGVDVELLLASLPLAPVPLTAGLVRGVAANRERIDELLAARVAPRWSLGRLAAVDRAILRLATYELLGEPERSQAVILNEAVVLARRFGTEDSPRFVNGVLSAVASEVRPEGSGSDVVDSAGHDDLDAETPGGHPGTDDVSEGAADPGPASNGGTRAPQVGGLIMDLDGVIRHWDEEALPAAERALSLPPGAIAAAAFDEECLARAMRGEISAQEWADEVGATVAAAHPVSAEAVSRAFSEVGWRIDESVLDLIDRARRQVPVALLSNASSRLVDDLRLSGILDRFDVVVGSAELGVCKPDRAALLAAAERLGVPPERCLLVDDTADNVTVARRLGMRAVQFDDVDDLADELVAAGVLDPTNTRG